MELNQLGPVMVPNQLGPVMVPNKLEPFTVPNHRMTLRMQHQSMLTPKT